MLYCIRTTGNTMVNGGIVDCKSPDFHADSERATFGSVTIFLIREWAKTGPNSVRNVICTYLINYHSELHPNNDFRIINGPHRLIAIDENNGIVLGPNQLEYLTQDIRSRMNADILSGKYATDITPAAGAAIKVTLY